MSAYIIAQFDVHDVDAYHDYASKILPTLEPFGGRIVAANDAVVREGSIPHLRTIVGEFASLETARAWYDSPAYQAIAPIRQSATTGHLFMVEGLVMPPRNNA